MRCGEPDVTCVPFPCDRQYRSRLAMAGRLHLKAVSRITVVLLRRPGNCLVPWSRITVGTGVVGEHRLVDGPGPHFPRWIQDDTERRQQCRVISRLRMAVDSVWVRVQKARRARAETSWSPWCIGLRRAIGPMVVVAARATTSHVDTLALRLAQRPPVRFICIPPRELFDSPYRHPSLVSSPPSISRDVPLSHRPQCRPQSVSCRYCTYHARANRTKKGW